MSGKVCIEKGSESGLLGAVANVGPVAVAVDGSSNAFRVSLMDSLDMHVHRACNQC